jgi:hypothetical protein
LIAASLILETLSEYNGRVIVVILASDMGGISCFDPVFSSLVIQNAYYPKTFDIRMGIKPTALYTSILFTKSSFGYF